MSLRGAKEDARTMWDAWYGPDADINLAGKIVLTPIIVVMAATWLTCELLFGKDKT